MKKLSLDPWQKNSWVNEISRVTLRADLMAGLLGGILVLPQAIAFALLAGLPPQYGLYTAIVPCIVAAIFGSSRHVISGPTNANSLALFAMLTPLATAGSPQYIEMALVVTVMVGLIQASVSLLRLGTLANLISPSALFGFMIGAGTLIAIHATGDALGLPDPPGDHATQATIMFYLANWHHVSIASLMVAVSTIVATLMVRRLSNPRVPAMLVGIIVGTILGLVLNALPKSYDLGRAEIIGLIPSIWPGLGIPKVDWTTLPDLFSTALALSIVALGQSISIAKAMASRTGQAVDANKEFWGQGLSNIVGGFFSCYVSCGSLNRSLPNAEAGARTPVAAISSAIWVLLLVAIFGQWLQFLPTAAIGGLLLVIAWSLIDAKGWPRLWRINKAEFLIAMATALATVFLRMEIAILLGTLLSLLVYLNGTAKPTVSIMGFFHRHFNRQLESIEANPTVPALTCPQLQMVRVEGDVYFGSTAHLSKSLNALRDHPDSPKRLLVMARGMNYIDFSGADLWNSELRTRREMGGDLYFHRPRDRAMDVWCKTGFLERLGEDHIFRSKSLAISSIFPKLDPEVCRTCKTRAFKECESVPPPNDSSSK